jgi:hypoxanthine phosphoribosyltransferase|tara:strand:- start:981 stop:1313 length:333 start_codon:yes stop_codon:yes gene_type:complete
MKFAHPSEQTFTEHLDLFNIPWIYEPTSFPLKWGSGSIKKMFTPDFYLPTFNIYIEITTMNQKLITKKKNKIKLAKKLYPNNKFKLINEKEFNNFLAKDKLNLIQEAIAS